MDQRVYVKTRDEERIRILTLDNPSTNLLNMEVLKELREVVQEAGIDDNVGCVIISGAGNKYFSAGLDLKTLRDSPSKCIDIVRAGQLTFNEIENLPKPVIAAVNGLALGGGNELCMVCDIRIASDRSQFAQPEVCIGIMPGWGGTQRLPRLVGATKAKEMIFTGQRIDAQEALRIGLVNKIVPQGEEIIASSNMARHIIERCAPLSVVKSKKAINEGVEKVSMREALELEVERFKEIALLSDMKEGVDAFFGKRPPRFVGR